MYVIEAQAQTKRKRVLTLLTVTGIVVFSWVLYAYLYSPKLGELKDLQNEISRKQAQMEDEVRKQNVAINISEDEMGEWTRKIERVNMRLPDRENFEKLLYDIGKMARKMGLNDFKLEVETGNEEEEPGKSSAPSSKQISVAKRQKVVVKKKWRKEHLPVNAAVLKIGFSSGYRELANFLEDITKNARAMSLDKIEVGRNGEKMIAKVTIKAYYREEDGTATE
jgi:Tfp pilus assembly protein PilO